MIETKEQYETAKEVLVDAMKEHEGIIYALRLDGLYQTIEALRDVARAAKRADKILLPYWMGPEFGEKPTDKQIYGAIADLNQVVAALPDWLTDD
jgi:hypothetical protein